MRDAVVSIRIEKVRGYSRRGNDYRPRDHAPMSEPGSCRMDVFRVRREGPAKRRHLPRLLRSVVPQVRAR